MANVKFIAVSRGLRGIVDYVTNREKTVEQLSAEGQAAGVDRRQHGAKMTTL